MATEKSESTCWKWRVWSELIESQYELQRQDHRINGINGFPYILQFWWFSPAENNEGSDRTSGGGRTSLTATGFIFSSAFPFWETRPVTWERSKGSEWDRREGLKGWEGSAALRLNIWASRSGKGKLFTTTFLWDKKKTCSKFPNPEHLCALL